MPLARRRLAWTRALIGLNRSACMPATYPVRDALDQLRPMLDSYPDGHMSREDITNGLANYQAK